MLRQCPTLCLLFSLFLTSTLLAAEESGVAKLLSRPIIGTELSQNEVMDYTDGHVMPMPEVRSVAQWEAYVEQRRQETFARVIYRGRAAGWRDAKAKVEFLEQIPGGPGYTIRKLRYEAVPGLWIPALLYEPENLDGKAPVIMNVNGHDPKGKATPYKQIRCINQAKRGIIALNVEWFGMGQLKTENFLHYRMNQIDLCGTSGFAPFYLSMKRGLDLLLAHPHADPQRVGVTGLSGGGCQTIQISGLDSRVTLADPVAGYSSFHTRARYLSDLGDSEQTPVDLGVTADYAHLTAMRAPHATLLTYNEKDNCCFRAEHALPPLLEAARPIFKLYGKEENLRSHINIDPGTHNYEKDNRQQLYRLIGDHFFAGNASFDAAEIPCDDEVKTAKMLEVPLPDNNADFHSLAVADMADLPKTGRLPNSAATAAGWQRTKRARLRGIVKAKSYSIEATADGEQEAGGVKATYWRMKMDGEWTVPAVELTKGTPKSTVILISDAGRGSSSKLAEQLLADGKRVLAVDPFYFGESKIKNRDYLFALLVSAVGDRPLGVQAGQISAIARWAVGNSQMGRVRVVADGHRTCVIALVAAALEGKSINGVELHGSLGSLKQVIEENRPVTASPELFCFGLLEEFDIAQLAAVVAPNTVKFVNPSDRVKKELAGLKAFYAALGIPLDPLQ